MKPDEIEATRSSPPRTPSTASAAWTSTRSPSPSPGSGCSSPRSSVRDQQAAPAELRLEAQPGRRATACSVGSKPDVRRRAGSHPDQQESLVRGGPDLRRSKTRRHCGRDPRPRLSRRRRQPAVHHRPGPGAERRLPQSSTRPATGSTRSACRSPSDSGNWRSARGNGSSRTAMRSVRGGYIGMITANSFMKREFGKKLIEEFFPKIDLTHVIDTRGVHPRPRHADRDPVRASPQAGRRTRCGPCWASRANRLRPTIRRKGWSGSQSSSRSTSPDAQDDFTSTADVPGRRSTYHPWSIGGGGAANSRSSIERCQPKQLGELVDQHWLRSDTCADDVFVRWDGRRPQGDQHAVCQANVIGDDDPRLVGTDQLILRSVPYDDSHSPVALEAEPSWTRRICGLAERLLGTEARSAEDHVQKG